MSVGILSLYPNAGSYNASTNADKVRGNTQWLEELAIFMGEHPDFDGSFSFPGGVLTTETWTEQLAAATADGRGNSTRKVARITYSYTAGVLVKELREMSYDNGTNFAIWTGRAGNAFSNYAYSSGNLSTITRATS